MDDAGCYQIFLSHEPHHVPFGIGTKYFLFEVGEWQCNRLIFKQFKILPVKIFNFCYESISCWLILVKGNNGNYNGNNGPVCEANIWFLSENND